MFPTALLVDFDGVLRRWNDDDAEIEARNRLPAGSIRRVAFSPGLLEPVITGAVSDEFWRARTAAELQRAYPTSMSREAVAQWSAHAGEIEPRVLAVISRCRAEFRLVLATNATSRLSSDVRRLGLADRFHAIANSSELGATKPSAAFFEAALRLADAKAGEALFVDDTPANVQAAATMGMHAHHFTTPEAMSDFLRDAGAFASGEL